MRLRRLVVFLTAFLIAPLAVRAQTQTAVSATITDPNGIPYANGTYSIQLIPTGNNPSVGGAAIQGAFNGSLSATGSFSASLWPNASITPASTQWQFTICSNSGGIQPPLGTGTQCTPPTAITISGTAQVLTTTLSNVAPKLTNFASSGSGTLTCSISGGVIFETAANTGGCATGFTFSTPNLTIPLNGGYEINGTVALALPQQASSLHNLAVGDNSLPLASTGFNNVAVGSSTMTLTTTGVANTAVGVGAMQNAAAGASDDTGIGNGALPNVTSNNNTAVGQGALSSLTSGNNNTAVGSGTGGNTTGSGNTLVGELAGNNLIGGNSNTIIGIGLTNAVTTGSNNIVIGNALASAPGSSSNQIDIGDVILGTGINVPATSTITLPGNLTVTGTCTGCGSGAVSSVSGDGTVITNSASTGAVTLTIAGTSGGIPYFNNATHWASSGALAAGVLVKGGGAGTSPAGSSFTDNGTAVVGTEPIRLPNGSASTPSYSFSASTTDGWYERTSSIMDMALSGSTPNEFFTGGIRQGSNGVFGFTNTSSNAALAFDTGISRVSAGVVGIGTGASGNVAGTLQSGAYQTGTNCSSSASPAVCGSAAAGSVALPTNAVSSSIQVNTTAVTASSQIFAFTDDTLGTKLGVTCNSTVATLVGGLTISARTAGTSFTIANNVAVVTNPLCVSYLIVN